MITVASLPGPPPAAAPPPRARRSVVALFNRTVLWALAGAILAAYPVILVEGVVGAHPSRAGLRLIVLTCAAVGVHLSFRGPDALRRHAPKAFVTAYVSLLGWGLVCNDAPIQGLAFLTAVAIAVVVFSRRSRTRSAEVRRIVAKHDAWCAWFLSVLLLPLYGLGLAFVPIAVALGAACSPDRYPGLPVTPRTRRWRRGGGRASTAL